MNEGDGPHYTGVTCVDLNKDTTYKNQDTILYNVDVLGLSARTQKILF